MATSYVSGSGGTTSGSSVTVTAPASIAAGNLLVAFIYTANSASTWTVPTGFVSQGHFTSVGTMAIYTKVATASEPTSYTFGSSASFIALSLVQYAGTSGLDGVAKFGAISGTTAASPSQTVNAGDGLVVAYGSFSGGSFSTPTGMAARTFARAAGLESVYPFDALSSPAASYTTTMSSSDSGVSASLLLAPAAAGGGATVAGALSGAGTVTATAARATAATAALSGAGQLTATATATTTTAAAVLGGDGGLAATAAETDTAAAPLDGVGQLSASTVSTTARTDAYLSGAGVLSAVSAGGQTTAAGLVGAGVLSATTRIPRPARNLTLTVGRLSGRTLTAAAPSGRTLTAAAPSGRTLTARLEP